MSLFEPGQATITASEPTIGSLDNHQGTADFHVTADSQTWLGFPAKERKLIWALLALKIRVKGPLKLFTAFARCFPS